MNMDMYLARASEYPTLSAEEEIELAKRIEQGDLEAREQMINANLKLVVHVAKWYQGRGVEIEDLIQEGNIGLIEAAESYDHRQGTRFSTYAVWKIRQKITYAIVKYARLIRLPHGKVEQLNRLKKAIPKLAKKLDRPPSLKEVATEMQISLEEVKELVKLDTITVSLDQQVTEGSTLGDIAVFTDFPEEEIITKIYVDDLVSRLSDRDRKIIYLRFGLNGQKEHPFQEIGQKLGITGTRVRQLTLRILKEIKRSKRGVGV